MLRASALYVLLLVVGCGRCINCGDAANAIDAVSDIKPDETVVFFRTSGWLDEANQEWHLPVHGWIYEPQENVARKAAFEKIMVEKFDLAVSEETQHNFSRRFNLLIADNERGKTIIVNIAGSNHKLPVSAENGHFEMAVVISAADAAKHSKNGLIPYTAVTGGTGNGSALSRVVH